MSTSDVKAHTTVSNKTKVSTEMAFEANVSR